MFTVYKYKYAHTDNWFLRRIKENNMYLLF